jgi:hypothetical protein
MKHRYTTLAITAIVATIAITAVGFGIAQPAFAHYGQHNNNHNRNSIDIDQQINQLNACSHSLCINTGTNNATVH